MFIAGFVLGWVLLLWLLLRYVLPYFYEQALLQPRLIFPNETERLRFVKETSRNHMKSMAADRLLQKSIGRR